jgi:uncharacterized protein (TIRG00374 family)
MSQPTIKYNRFIIIGVIALLVTGIVIIALDRNSISGIIGKANWLFVGLALISTGLSYFFQCFSFVILNRLFDINPGFGMLFKIGYVSLAIGNIVSTPLGITEHAIRSVLLVPRGYRGGDVVAASVSHSYIKDVAILFLAPGVLLFQVLTEHLASNVSRILTILAILAVALLIVYSLIFLSKNIRGFILRGIAKIWRLIVRRNSQKQTGDFNNAIEQTKTELSEHPRLGFLLLGFMFGDWIFTLVTFELCFMAFGLVTPFTSLTSGYIVGRTAALLSLIPGGIGIQSTSTAGIYSLLGIPFSIALLVAVLFRVVYQYIPYISSFPLFRSLLRLASQNQKKR